MQDVAILTKREAAAIARISERTMDRLCGDGRGPPRIKLSERRIGFDREALIAWLRARSSDAR